MNSSVADQLLSIVQSMALPGTFNPWVETNHDDVSEASLQWRVAALRRHIEIPTCSHVLVGEGMSYQGGRLSGLAFTSEALLLEGAIARQQLTQRLSTRQLPWREPSATIVWKTLYKLGIQESTVLWNALPVHPFTDPDRLTNRPPRRSEIDAGIPALELLRSAFPHAKLVAVGEHANRTLTRLGYHPTLARHPAFGGANEFAAALARTVLPHAA